jgi:hypothetical protein
LAAVAWARHGLWLWLAGAGVLAVLLLVLFLFDPAHHAFYPVCMFHRVTGLQCPGCGGLRAAHHLLHGEVLTAFRYNPLVVLAAPVAALLLARRWWQRPRTGAPPLRAHARWAWGLLTLLLVFWVVRNLPLECFKLPAS